MNEQNIERRSARSRNLPAILPRLRFGDPFYSLRGRLIQWERLMQDAMVRSPLLHLPFLLAIPLFLLSLGLVVPAFQGRDTLRFEGGSVTMPQDQSLADILLHFDSVARGEVWEDQAQAQEPLPEAVPVLQTLETQNYVVQPGDSISVIANRFSRTMATLISWNSITNVRRIQPGQSLVIPNMDGIRYVVRRGDSLSGIARAHDLTYDALLDANNMESPVISPGMELFLPGAAMNRIELRTALGELFIWPTRGRFTSGYGWRSDPFTGLRRFHNGIDLANVPGTPIVSVMEGRVSDVGFHSVYGNYVTINHDGGYQTLYGHLRAYSVRRGQRVTQGQRIGEMGSTGYSTGSHLHFTLFRRNQHINPMQFLP